MLANRQTQKQTNTLISILRHPYRGWSKNLVKLERVVQEICSLRDRQTDRYMHMWVGGVA